MKNEKYAWLKNSIETYYQLERVLKKEKNKEILLYQHKRLDKRIVVKHLEDVCEVYTRLVAIRHEALVDVLDIAADGKRVLVVEEFVDGVSLADMLELEPLSLKRMQKMLFQICDGLTALHENNIIHRDIKPENVSVLPDDRVKLMDFDVARIYRPEESKDTIALGTIGYAAPEQYGEAQSDARTDIYALGILINVMATGKHPVQETVRGPLGRIIEKCIVVNPKKRYSSVSDVKKELKKVIY